MPGISHPASSPNDELAALRRYATSGDPRAFELLVHRYQDMVLATCRRSLRGGADAEDAVQETFLKLARGAGSIRANLAAWLHACAVRTSIDIIRKRGSQDRAEIAHAGAPPAVEPEKTWQEIQPLLDAALAELDDDERELIVVRYFMGRPEVEMAREAGVSPGTMNRRIDRAVAELRRRLGARGLSAAGATGLGTALTLGISPPADASVTAAIMHVGVAGVPASVGASSTGWGGMGLIAAGILALSTVIGAGVLMVRNGQSPPSGVSSRAPSASATGGAASDGTGVERPGRTVNGLKLAGLRLGHAAGESMRSDGQRLRMQVYQQPDVPPTEIVLLIESVDRSTKPHSLKLKAESSTSRKSEEEGLVGQRFDGSFAVDGEFITLKLHPMLRGQKHDVQMTMIQAQLPAGAAAAPIKIEGAPAPELAGLWHELGQVSLTINEDEITAGSGEFVLFRFRIMEWSKEEALSRVNALCARHYNETWIGERVRLLLRRTALGYELAMPAEARGTLAIEPAGFDLKPGDRSRVLVFSKEAR